MLVARIVNAFIPPYNELLRKTSDKLFESGISQIYTGITIRRRMEYDGSKLIPLYRNRSVRELKSVVGFLIGRSSRKDYVLLGPHCRGLGSRSPFRLKWRRIPSSVGA